MDWPETIQWDRAAADAAVRAVIDALRKRGGMVGMAATALERHHAEALSVAMRALAAAWTAQRQSMLK